MEEAQQATAPVALRHPRERCRHARESGDGRHGVERNARDEQHRHDDAREDERGAEVGLHQDEERDDAEHEQHWDDGQPRRTHVVGAPGEDIGREDDHGELGELRRLDPEEADAQPAGGAADRDAEARHQHEHQERHREEQQGDHEPAPDAVVDAHGDHQEKRADTDPEQLALEEDPGAAVDP